MSLESFAKGVRGFVDDPIGVGLVVAATIFGSMNIAGNAVEDNWDNNPTEKTEQVLKNIENQFLETQVQSAEFSSLTAKKELYENNNGTWEKWSDEWIVYQKQADAAQEGQDSLFASILTNQEIPESTFADLREQFQEAGMVSEKFDQFSDEAFSLKECQATVSGDDISGQAAKVQSCMIEKDDFNDDVTFVAFVGGLVGGFVLAFGGIPAGARRVEKYAKNRNHKKSKSFN